MVSQLCSVRSIVKVENGGYPRRAGLTVSAEETNMEKILTSSKKMEEDGTKKT